MGDGPRIAMLSVHTSPLDQPGTGDAGGMNVYLTELSRALAGRGALVDIFTRTTSPDLPEMVQLSEGVLVRHVAAGPPAPMDKGDLPDQTAAFTAGLLRACRPAHGYGVVHSHYWLSGLAALGVARCWDAPLVHTMHTLAKVKNASLAPGDSPEPPRRVRGEEQVVAAAHALVANTAQEAGDLVRRYCADPEVVHVVEPGVGAVPADQVTGLLGGVRHQSVRRRDDLLLPAHPPGRLRGVAGGESGVLDLGERVHRVHQRRTPAPRDVKG